MLARIERWWLQGVLWLNARLKSAAVRLTRLSGRSRVAIHPKHLLETDPELHWYVRHLTAGMAVLDIGCGHGMPAIRVAERVTSVVGLDRHLVALEAAGYLQAKHETANLSLLAADAESALPLRTDSFDAVLLLDVIEHLHGRVTHLSELHRLLRDDGILLLSAPNRDTSWKRRLRSAGLRADADPDHKTEYVPAELAAELESAGFRLEGEFSPVVTDTPWAGVIDLVGAVCPAAYRRLSGHRRRLAQNRPDETTGWQVRCRKMPRDTL